MHSHGALQTLSELSDTLFLLVDLIISRYLMGEYMTETYSSFETISTFDHGTEIPGNAVPQLSLFEIFLAIESAWLSTQSRENPLETIQSSIEGCRQKPYSFILWVLTLVGQLGRLALHLLVHRQGPVAPKLRGP